MATADPTPKSGLMINAKLLLVLIVGLFVWVGTCSLRRDNTPSPPTTSTYRAAAQELVRQRLRDPSSAEFSEVRVIPALPGKRAIVCGRVNARNGFGGMTGPQRFIVGGTVALEGEIGDAAIMQLWTQFC